MGTVDVKVVRSDKDEEQRKIDDYCEGDLLTLSVETEGIFEDQLGGCKLHIKFGDNEVLNANVGSPRLAGSHVYWIWNTGGTKVGMYEITAELPDVSVTAVQTVGQAITRVALS